MSTQQEIHSGKGNEVDETKIAATRDSQDEVEEIKNQVQDELVEDVGQAAENETETTSVQLDTETLPVPDGEDGSLHVDTEEDDSEDAYAPSLISDSTSVSEFFIYAIGEEGDEEDPGLMHPEDHARIVEFCQKDDAELLNESTPEELAREYLVVAQRHYKDMNLLASKQNTAMTMLRIGLGKFFLKLKRVVRKSGKLWKEWVTANAAFINERTLSDYMLLAKQPGIENYAVLGKERLLLIVRAIKGLGFNADDPVGDFLRGSRINITRDSEEDINELEVKIDTAVEMRKLANKGITTVPQDKVELMVRNRKKLSALHLAALRLCPNKEEAFDEFLNDGKIVPPLTAETVARALKKGTEALSKVARDITRNPALARRVDEETRNEIRGLITALQGLTEEQAAEAA